MLRKAIRTKLTNAPGGLDILQRGPWLPLMQRVAKGPPVSLLHLFCQVLSGTAPTGSNLGRWGYAVCDLCPLCRQALDTLWHR
eukprot:7117425-Pyramimonas_sp.AAC.1